MNIQELYRTFLLVPDKEFYENCLKNKLRKYYNDAFRNDANMSLITCPREMAFAFLQCPGLIYRKDLVKINLEYLLSITDDQDILDRVMILYNHSVFDEESNTAIRDAEKCISIQKKDPFGKEYFHQSIKVFGKIMKYHSNYIKEIRINPGNFNIMYQTTFLYLFDMTEELAIFVANQIRLSRNKIVLRVINSETPVLDNFLKGLNDIGHKYSINDPIILEMHPGVKDAPMMTYAQLEKYATQKVQKASLVPNKTKNDAKRLYEYLERLRMNLGINLSRKCFSDIFFSLYN